MEKPVAFLREKRSEHLSWSVDLCRIPSISTKPEHKDDVRRAVQWTHDLCKRVGFSAKIMETGGHPLVYADWCNAPGRPTLLVYGHVDVQPTGDLKLWNADPFDPQIKGDWLIARGSADDKGQVLVHVRAAQAWLATEKRLPVNVKLLIEGEEEIGSPNLAKFVKEHKDLLKCDQVVISDTGMYDDGWPAVTVGTRGIVGKEVFLSGPRHDLHSGTHGGVVANPIVVLSKLIASLHDDNGRVTIPGFYDDVAELPAAARKAINDLPFDEKKYLEELGSPAFTGEKGYTTQERRSIRPTLELNGITGGYQGVGGNTIVPARASAKFTMRLVPNQKAARIADLFIKTVKERVPDTVRCEVEGEHNCDPYVTPAGSMMLNAGARGLKEAFGKDPVMMFEGGSLPILPMFKSVLGADSLMLGFASPRCNAHGPNECANIKDLDLGAEAVARFLAYAAG